VLLTAGAAVQAAPHDTTGNYRLSRMRMISYDCPLPPAVTPVDIEYDCRNTTVTDYRAIGSVTFGPGFTTETNASFIAEIVPGTFGVPQATHLTGTADVNINWIQSTSFDENGNVIADGKQFFDNNGKASQAQNKVFYPTGTSTVYTHVIASQPIHDAYGRDAATTLPAPIDYADFSYQSNFLQHNTSGTIYNHQNFDLGSSGTDKTLTPEALWDVNAATPVQGTLAWYYSRYNNWEQYTPETAYPYSRQSFYQDGTGSKKSSATSGDQLRMGMGRDQSGYISPVVNELEDYMRIRNHFFSTADLGEMPGNLQSQAVLKAGKDPNGRETIAIQDKGGHTLMSARPGTDLTPSANVVTLNALQYSLTVPALPSGSGCSFGTQLVTIYGNGTTFTLTNPANYTLTLTGPLNGNTVDFTPTDWGTVIRSDAPFTISYTDKQGSSCGGAPVFMETTTATSGAPRDYYFKILADATPVTITGAYTLYNMATETTTSLLTGNLLNRGYYKIMANSGTVTLTYANSFTDVCYTFYDQKGQVVAKVSPEGVKKMYGSGINNYTTKTAMPYTQLLTYDLQGHTTNITDPDGGTYKYVYRKDGTIRFSQNSVQAAAGSYSYTNYDALGRFVESGQYLPDASGIPFGSAAMTGILENISPGGGLTTGTKTDVILTTYDVADNSHGVTGYTQDVFTLAGAVSMTRRYSSIVNNNPVSANMVSATWYNYDVNGKVVWKIRYVNGLGYKTNDYTFDVLGNLVKTVFQKTTPAETFVHYYDYDPARAKLRHVYTNTTDNPSTKILQATYFYYLHGGLRRVELAAGLQGVDYTYTLQGALKSINNSNKALDPGKDGTGNGIPDDAFGEVLDYFAGDYVNTKPQISAINGVDASAITSDSYAGNVKAMTWFSEKPSVTGLTNAPVTNVYQYDSKYQFLENTWGTTLNFNTAPASFTPTGINKEKLGNGSSPAYDMNGNILSLQRTDANGNILDQFGYHYDNNNNQLTSILNTATSQPYATFTYDGRGQVTGENTGDANQKYMVYNVSGKVIAVYRDAGHAHPVAAFVYDEAGKRIKKLSYNNTDQLIQVTYYSGDVIFSQAVTNSGTTIGPILTQEYQINGLNRIGIYNPQIPLYAYQLTDHLGNVRAVVVRNAATYQVREYSDYYPYGYLVGTGGANDYRYGYQGQYAEKDQETSLNAFELRMYDSRIARWLQFDPKGQSFSPYAAMGNNPVSIIDKDGGFFEELLNLFTHGMWISNSGYAAYTALQAQNLDPQYNWVGSRVKGYGFMTWVTPGADPTDTKQDVLHGQKFEAVRDVTHTINGQMFAIYPDLELSITGGLRAAEVAPARIEGFDLNLFSVDLVKYSFAENKKSYIWNPFDWKDLSVSMGAEVDLDGLGVETGLSYGKGNKLESTLGVGAGILTIEMEKDLMEKEAASTMGIGLSGDAKFGLGIVGEAKLTMKVVRIPNNDENAWYKAD